DRLRHPAVAVSPRSIHRRRQQCWRWKPRRSLTPLSDNPRTCLTGGMPWRKTDVVKERTKFILSWERRWEATEGRVNVVELCREFGISRDTVTSSRNDALEGRISSDQTVRDAPGLNRGKDPDRSGGIAQRTSVTPPRGCPRHG